MVRGGSRLKTGAASLKLYGHACGAPSFSPNQRWVSFALRTWSPPQFFVSSETFCCNFGQKICTLESVKFSESV